MANFKFGDSHGTSTLGLKVSLTQVSKMEVTVGDGYDMSQRQIDIVERDMPQMTDLIGQLRSQTDELEKLGAGAAPVVSEARSVAEKSEAIATSRTWQHVSLSGLAAAAASFGAAAMPVLEGAAKVVELLKSIKGL